MSIQRVSVIYSLWVSAETSTDINKRMEKIRENVVSFVKDAHQICRLKVPVEFFAAREQSVVWKMKKDTLFSSDEGECLYSSLKVRNQITTRGRA